MAIDQYAPCPCGNGKKIKFCKCVDNFQDYEKVVRMIEADQALAAVERINELLQQSPNTAWLLALKAELAFRMQEVETFQETANRFVKLKPDNPLALSMKALSSLISAEPIQDCARPLLQSLTAGKEFLPEITVTATQLLVQTLLSTNKQGLLGFWLDLLMQFRASSEDSTPIAADTRLSLLSKTSVRVVDEEEQGDWGERLGELDALLYGFEYEQASKRASVILRDFPGQIGALSRLLTAQMAQLDEAGAAQTVEKLIESNDLTSEERIYYRAIGLNMGPSKLSTKQRLLYAEVDSTERVAEALGKLDDYVLSGAAPREEELRALGMLVEDEVPAQNIIRIKNNVTTKLADGDSVEISTLDGFVVLYGKQTDKPARVLFQMFDMGESTADCIAAVEEALAVGEEMDFANREAMNQSCFDFAMRQIVGVADEKKLDADTYRQFLADQLLTAPMNCLGDRSLLEVKDEEPLRELVAAICTCIEASYDLPLNDAEIGYIYSQLGLERESFVALENEEQKLGFESLVDIERIQVDHLTPGQAGELLRVSSLFGVRRSAKRVAEVINESPEKYPSEVQLLAAAELYQGSTDIGRRIELGTKLKEMLSERGRPIGRLVFDMASQLENSGDHKQAEQIISTALREHPEDPELNAIMQQMMQMQGMGQPQPGGAPAPAAAPQADSGLVLPGQESGGGDSSGESKLWLPGT